MRDKDKRGVAEKKKKNDLTDIISYLDSSGTMPKVNVDSNYDLHLNL